MIKCIYVALHFLNIVLLQQRLDVSECNSHLYSILLENGLMYHLLYLMMINVFASIKYFSRFLTLAIVLNSLLQALNWETKDDFGRFMGRCMDPQML